MWGVYCDSKINTMNCSSPQRKWWLHSSNLLPPQIRCHKTIWLWSIEVHIINIRLIISSKHIDIAPQTRQWLPPTPNQEPPDNIYLIWRCWKMKWNTSFNHQSLDHAQVPPQTKWWLHPAPNLQIRWIAQSFNSLPFPFQRYQIAKWTSNNRYFADQEIW